MPTSKSFLLDVNCWLAAVAQRHVHHPAAKSWIDSTRDRLVFCRVTQMAFLRLTTNPKVMDVDVLSPAQAWAAYDRLLADPRVTFADEPAGFETIWRRLIQRSGFSRARWTDSYLAAFAEAGRYGVVTFDKDFRSLTCGEIQLLA